MQRLQGFWFSLLTYCLVYHEILLGASFKILLGACFKISLMLSGNSKISVELTIFLDYNGFWSSRPQDRLKFNVFLDSKQY